MRLILVRHGSTHFNEDGIVLGRSDPPLTPTGLAQAQALAHSLRAEQVQAVYTSPLARARQTAQAIAAAFRLEPVLEPGLLELDVGDFDGLTFEQLRKDHPQFLERWAQDAGPLVMPGGESLQGLQARAWDAVQTMSQRHPQATVVAVTHNFAILVILCQALGVPLARFRRFKQKVGAKSVLELPSGRAAVLVSMNDRCHLPGSAP
ncbi:MAG: histidine phosphatase family protein [Dehalococcoidia bacterium]|nr:histidine phosphatase family protein [Dehalococcoidia bacterium]